MRFGVLGPLEVVTSGPGRVPVTPRAPKIRTVLATLLIRANDIVSASALIDELWDDDPPRTALSTLQVYVSQLRKLLHRADPQGGRAALGTRAPGYLLRLEPGQLDLTAFEELHARGGAALRRRDYAAASDLQHRALALWRGPLLSDTPHGPLLASAAVRLTELRMAALDRRIRADLGLGLHRDLVGELQELAIEYPVREELHAHLMVALYRSGRQADALRVYERLRRTLADELSIEPGRGLQQLRGRIQAGDATLLHRSEQAPPRRGPRPVAEPAATVALPDPDPAFTGRADALAQTVDGLLQAVVDGGQVVVHGMAGVGKTAVAVAAAHRAAPLYPDGRVFLPLRSPVGEPLSPAQALTQLLRYFGVRPPRTAGLAERRALLQRLLDGRRVLLVLDGATSEGQIRALPPIPAGSSVLVTCRWVPAETAGRRVLPLAEPGTEAARHMFAALAGCQAEAPSVAEIVELCGRLPLAVRAAALLTARPHLNAELLAERLRDERHRLSVLGGDPDAPGSVLRAAYAEASPAERRTFRLLGLLPPGPFTPEAATVALGGDPLEAEAALEALAATGLLGRDRAGGTYRLHPLFRLLASGFLAEEEPRDTRLLALAAFAPARVAPVPGGLIL